MHVRSMSPWWANGCKVSVEPTASFCGTFFKSLSKHDFNMLYGSTSDQSYHGRCTWFKMHAIDQMGLRHFCISKHAFHALQGLFFKTDRRRLWVRSPQITFDRCDDSPTCYLRIYLKGRCDKNHQYSQSADELALFKFDRWHMSIKTVKFD